MFGAGRWPRKGDAGMYRRRKEIVEEEMVMLQCLLTESRTKHEEQCNSLHTIVTNTSYIMLTFT